jgi:glycosyltransferase involved in cell wall biosynthesis
MNYPKISIVTPNLNQGKYLERAILSVLTQKYPNLEYIIIDGGSTDNSIDIIKKYENNLSYWISEKDSGQSEAINKGLRKCTGQIFNWLNADDVLIENTLFEVAHYFTNYDIEILCGFCHIVRNNIFEKKYTMRIGKDVEDTIIHPIIAQPSTFFDLERIKELHFLNENLHYVMDYELWLRYLTKYGQNKIMSVEKDFAIFHIHDESKTGKSLNKFQPEINAIQYNLLKSVGMKSFVLKKIKQNAVNFYKNKWDFTSIDKKKYLKDWCAYHIHRWVFVEQKRWKSIPYIWADFLCNPRLSPLKMLIKDIFLHMILGKK